jgi:Transcriptional regulators
MKELDYQPSAAARQLRGQGSQIIGIIVPRITNPFFSYLVDAIQQVTYQNGFQIMIFQSNEDKEKETSFLELLVTKQIDGIIMCAVENEREFVESYTKYGPIVLCNESFENSDIPTVILDQLAGAYMGIKYLLEKGRRKIAYCTGGLFEENGKDKSRNAGFHKAITEYGLKVNPEWIFVDQHTIEDGKQIARKIFTMSERPDAVFTGSDEVAAGLIVEAKKLGMIVPDQLSVLGFDDQPLAELTSPAITTVKQPIQELGQETVNLLLSILQSTKYELDREILKMSMVIRESA